MFKYTKQQLAFAVFLFSIMLIFTTVLKDLYIDYTYRNILSKGLLIIVFAIMSLVISKLLNFKHTKKHY